MGIQVALDPDLIEAVQQGELLQQTAMITQMLRNQAEQGDIKKKTADSALVLVPRHKT